MLLVLAGLPEPEVNLEIRDDAGVVRMRLDLSYPRVRLAIEYDGRHHLEDVAQWERDPERRDDLEDSDWRVLVVTSRGIYREPARTVFRVRRALRARGYRPLPPPSDAWRPYFRADGRQQSVA
jgi:very-short-patch-repair endonuclease